MLSEVLKRLRHPERLRFSFKPEKTFLPALLTCLPGQQDKASWSGSHMLCKIFMLAKGASCLQFFLLPVCSFEGALVQHVQCRHGAE